VYRISVAFQALEEMSIPVKQDATNIDFRVIDARCLQYSGYVWLDAFDGGRGVESCSADVHQSDQVAHGVTLEVSG
jgi:hypothetical protein